MKNITQKIITYREHCGDETHSEAHRKLYLTTEQQVQCMEWEGGHPVDVVLFKKPQLHYMIKQRFSNLLSRFKRCITPFSFTPLFGA
jgi:hypothetical protein